MAAVAQSLSSTSRQPFGALGPSRLRVLDSMKNHQNGLFIRLSNIPGKAYYVLQDIL